MNAAHTPSQDVQVSLYSTTYHRYVCCHPIASNKLSLCGINLGISKGTGLQHCRDKGNEAQRTNWQVYNHPSWFCAHYHALEVTVQDPFTAVACSQAHYAQYRTGNFSYLKSQQPCVAVYIEQLILEVDSARHRSIWLLMGFMSCGEDGKSCRRNPFRKRW